MGKEVTFRHIREFFEGYSIIDVGGGDHKKLPHADVILDIEASENNIRWDINNRPWPIEDKQFDISFSTHTLEDIRDPIGAVSELKRISKAGVIKCPMRLYEMASGKCAHHHWLVDIYKGSLRFTFVNKICYEQEIIDKYIEVDEKIGQVDKAIHYFWNENKPLRAFENYVYFKDDVEKHCRQDHYQYLKRVMNSFLTERSSGSIIKWMEETIELL